MKRAALLATLTLALSAAPAEAHVLSISRAKFKVERIAYRIADPGEYYGAKGCFRVTNHAVICEAWTYDDEDGIRCSVPIKVRFVGQSNRLTWRAVRQLNCT